MLAGTLLGQGPVRRQSSALVGDRGPAAAPKGWRPKRSGGVRFVAIIFLLVLAGLVGLFIYGQMMEPDLREIEVEATHAAQ
jgi:cell division septal protein FtsQ